MDKINFFSESLKNSLDRTSLVHSKWIEKNFKDPRNDRKQFSFKDHEFQVEIVDDDSVGVVVRKCAQVGLSTLQIRYILAFCSVNNYLKCAYILPTAKFANEFSATRVQPAIYSSDVVSNLAKEGDTSNVGIKEIGTCFLVMKGSTGQSQAISLDLDLLIVDELNFCDMEVIGSFASRLQHSDLKFTRHFSTPTVADYGIDSLYNESSQAERAVYCSRCNSWQVIDFYRDCIIPGFLDGVAGFNKSSSGFPGIASAYLQCDNCKGELTLENLNNPSLREWVRAYPDRDTSGYQVRYWDVPAYNTTPEVLASSSKYTLHSDWVNFRIGSSYSDQESSFLPEALHLARKPSYLNEYRGINNNNSTITISTISSIISKNVFIGVDLGKVSHVVIGVPRFKKFSKLFLSFIT